LWWTPKEELFIYSFGDQMGLFNGPNITKNIPKIEQLYSYALPKKLPGFFFFSFPFCNYPKFGKTFPEK